MLPWPGAHALSPEPLPLVHCLGSMEHTCLLQGLDLETWKEEAVKTGGRRAEGEQRLVSTTASSNPQAGPESPLNPLCC